MPSITITLTTQQTDRILHDLGIAKGLGRDATVQEAKDTLVQFIRDLVKSVEDQQATLAIPPTPDLGPVS